MLTSEVYLFGGNVYARDGGGRVAFNNGFGDDAAAAADVDPAEACGEIQPLDEFLS
jgi:hypothetical protein